MFYVSCDDVTARQSSRTPPTNHLGQPVVVVGAGPVGLSAALALAREGIDVRVLEAGPDVADRSRASTFHPATLEYLAELGVVDELLALGIRAPVYQLRERRGALLAEFDLQELSDETSYPFRLQCEQHKFCRIVRRHLEKEPSVELRFGSEVTGVTMLGERAFVGLANDEEIEASFVIAADGAHSVVARCTGSTGRSFTYPQRFLIASVDIDVPGLIPGLAHVSYLADPEDWMAVIHSPDHWRLLFGVDPRLPEDTVLDTGNLQQRVVGFLDPERKHLRGEIPLADVTLYRVHRKVLDNFRRGPIAFVGDAAHLNNPLGGQGMNSGIHDAVTLARNLALVLGRRGGDKALDAWASARRAVAEQYVLADTDANYRALSAADPSERAQHRANLMEMQMDAGRRKDAMRRSAMLNTARVGMPGSGTSQ